MTNETQLRRLLGHWLRQCSGGTPPSKVPFTPAVQALADEPTAQRIWTELLAQWPAQ